MMEILLSLAVVALISRVASSANSIAPVAVEVRKETIIQYLEKKSLAEPKDFATVNQLVNSNVVNAILHPELQSPPVSPIGDYSEIITCNPVILPPQFEGNGAIKTYSDPMGDGNVPIVNPSVSVNPVEPIMILKDSNLPIVLSDKTQDFDEQFLKNQIKETTKVKPLVKVELLTAPVIDKPNDFGAFKKTFSNVPTKAATVVTLPKVKTTGAQKLTTQSLIGGGLNVVKFPKN